MIGYTFFLLLGYRRSGPFFYIVASLVMAYIGIRRPVLSAICPHATICFVVVIKGSANMEEVCIHSVKWP
jgi:hypothetical protein